MNLKKMNQQRKLILLAAVAGLGSVFLPWARISIFGLSKNITGFHDWGILVFLAFTIAAIISLPGNQTAKPGRNYWLTVMGCGAVALSAVSMIILSSPPDIDGGIGLAETTIGIGAWIALAMSAAIILIAWVHRNPIVDLKPANGKLKKSISIPATSVHRGFNSKTGSALPPVPATRYRNLKAAEETKERHDELL